MVPRDSQRTLDTVARSKTFVDLLSRRASEQADQLAYRFLVDGEDQQVQVTYAQLERRARSVAAWLLAHVAPGQPVLLLHPPGLDFVVGLLGCFLAGTIGVPTSPPPATRRNSTYVRLKSILTDVLPSVVLAPQGMHGPLQPLWEQHLPPSCSCTWGDVADLICDDPSDSWSPSPSPKPQIPADSLAMIQYTSGSTENPRGVMLSHANLWHNSTQICQRMKHSAASRGVIWLPPYHDMGLIGGILQPLFVGFPVTLMSPIHFLQQPIRWLRAISQWRATTSGGPNFAYQLCVERITPAERSELDLSQWEVAFTGAEPIRADTLDRFSAAFAECGFRRHAFFPCYGLAEATLIVTGGEASAGPVAIDRPTSDRDGSIEHTSAAAMTTTVPIPNGASPRTPACVTAVGCGSSLDDQQLLIVDPEQRTCLGSGQIGEIWVRGPSVARGYWNRPDETRETFGQFLAEGIKLAEDPESASHSITGARLNDVAGAYLRTGDLGFLRAGELYVTGRLKDLLIVAGQNHYPQDIERTVQDCHPAIRPGCCAAFSVDQAGEEQLVVVAELRRRDVPQPEISRAIRRAVAEQHDLRVFDIQFLRPASIAQTSSGKIQRHICRARYLADNTKGSELEAPKM